MATSRSGRLCHGLRANLRRRRLAAPRPHFAPDAEREVLGGGPLALHSVGRDAVIGDLKRNVEDMDRRFDLRIPEIVAGPESATAPCGWTGA